MVKTSARKLQRIKAEKQKNCKKKKAKNAVRITQYQRDGKNLPKSSKNFGKTSIPTNTCQQCTTNWLCIDDLQQTQYVNTISLNS